ncbi:hypothetical protein Drorol1_Dr00026956, partial [Drosera rotundifolia]
MEHKSCSPQFEVAIMAFCERLQGYCCEDGDLAEDLKTQNAVSVLQAKQLAFDLECRMRYESCTADVLTEEEAKNFRSDVPDVERYGIARSEDQLVEVDIGGTVETPCPTFISHNLAPV